VIALPTLQPHRIHQQNNTSVWLVSLALAKREVLMLRSLLGEQERTRAERFRFPRDCRRFIVRRAALRLLLAECLPETASEIRFQVQPNGKPQLAHARDTTVKFNRIRFNTSSSGDYALIAINHSKADHPAVELGIDLEEIRPLPEMFEIAKAEFVPEDVASLISLAKTEQEKSFFQLWTRKEALVKADGGGLDAQLTPDDRNRFCITDITTMPNFRAALAVEKPAVC